MVRQKISSLIVTIRDLVCSFIDSLVPPLFKKGKMTNRKRERERERGKQKNERKTPSLLPPFLNAIVLFHRPFYCISFVHYSLVCVCVRVFLFADTASWVLLRETYFRRIGLEFYY